MTRTLALAMVAVLSVAACASSGSGSDRSHAETAPIESTSQATSNPNNPLTGFGATDAGWNSAHTADSDSQLVNGCCYGPQIEFYGQSSTTDTWVAVGHTDGVIDRIQHNFTPNTSRSDALAMVTHDDLPGDAVLVNSVAGDGCEIFIYRSATVASVDLQLGQYISFFFVSPPDESVYYPDNIWFATITSNDGPDTGTC